MMPTNGASPNVRIALLVLAVTLTRTTAQQVSCTRQDYDKCVKIADPLMKDPHLIFPDNMADIDLVCRRWSQFVDCVKRYTDKCLTEERRQDFNKAIASPVDSVHEMCTDSNFQKEYLQYATCIKSTIIKDEHCGRHYKHLVEQVAGEVSRVTLCCSHHRFRECVLIETKRECDKGKEGGSAARFSRQILDKALSFIKDQCYNYIPSSGYCPGVALPINREATPAVNVIVPDQQHGTTNTRPWQPQTNMQGADKRVTMPDNNAGKPWLPNTRTTEDRAGRDKWTQTQTGTSKQPSSMEEKLSSSSTAWLPTRTNLPQTTTTPVTLFHAAPIMPNTTPDQPSGESRPSSYGRGMSWTPTNTEPTDSLTKTWKVTSQDEIDKGKHKTDTWRPNVAGFGGGFHNQVDEPNQQGLANKNSAVCTSGHVSMFVFVALVALNGVVV